MKAWVDLGFRVLPLGCRLQIVNLGFGFVLVWGSDFGFGLGLQGLGLQFSDFVVFGLGLCRDAEVGLTSASEPKPCRLT